MSNENTKNTFLLYTVSKLENRKSNSSFGAASETASLSSYGITVYQFTEHYITNANTVPALILSFLYDIAGRHTQRLCCSLIRHRAACGWLLNIPALLTNPCQLNVNTGGIKHATHTAGQNPSCLKLPLI